MSQPLLVFDCHFMCHRAFHTAGHLKFEGKSTGVAFGFLKSLSSYKDQFETDRVVFCFEGGYSKRRELYPTYKQKREQDRSAEEKKAYEQLAIQINELQGRYLPQIGFRNIFAYRGYESDDVMAVIAAKADEEVILVTSDSDLFQCLRPNVSIYSPMKMRVLTDRWFRREYGIEPRQWAIVKAIAGCISDNVKGVGGVGESTALKYLRGYLDQDSKANRRILSQEGKFIVRRNRRLVQLPFKGCPVPEIRADKITVEAWKKTCADLGMRSIAGRPPIHSRRLSC